MDRWLKIPVKYINQDQAKQFDDLGIDNEPDYVEGHAFINERFVAGITEVFDNEGMPIHNKCRIITVTGGAYEVNRPVVDCVEYLNLNVIEL